MPGLVWTFLAPMGFYLAWQLCYFVIVQVGTRPAGALVQSSFYYAQLTCCDACPLTVCTANRNCRSSRGSSFWRTDMRRATERSRAVRLAPTTSGTA